MSPNASLRIVIAGYLVRSPLAGRVLSPFQYVLGLHRLGHKVMYLEDNFFYPSCYHPESNTMSNDPVPGLNIIKDLFKKFGLEDRVGYYDEALNEWFGIDKSRALEFCKSADLFINISGLIPMRDWFATIPYRLLIDTDPVFTQIKHLTDPDALALAKQHNLYFTYGENFGKSGCTIPDDGLPWKPTRQPMVNEVWKVIEGDSPQTWTTVMRWDSYKKINYNGVEYGMKSETFKDFINLPQFCNEKLEMAIGTSFPVDLIKDKGWLYRNPLSIKTIEDYHQYISQSKGEWSVAKQGYVISNSGWFSERSVAYLASGRPVIVQDTGFSKQLPTGSGLLCFNNVDDAIDCFNAVNSNYSLHCKMAREIAEAYFTFKIVLNSLLTRL